MPIVNFLKTSDNTYPDVSANNPLPVTSTFASGSEVAIDQSVEGTTNRVVADTELPAAVLLGDLVANPTTPIVGAALMLWNGSQWERSGSNRDFNLLVSASRTATISSGTLTNPSWRGLHVSLSVTNAGTGDITLKIEAFSPFVGTFHTLLEGVSVTTVSATEYKLYPGLTAVANSVANDILHRSWRVTVTHNNANPITYSVTAMLVL